MRSNKKHSVIVSFDVFAKLNIQFDENTGEMLIPSNQEYSVASYIMWRYLYFFLLKREKGKYANQS